MCPFQVINFAFKLLSFIYIFPFLQPVLVIANLLREVLRISVDGAY
jgi:hypothetical protein